MIIAQDFSEYCAALSAAAVYNVNRRKETPFITPDQVMLRFQARQGAGKPAMRYAKPGERPPSSRPPGTPDNVIERFDAYANKRNMRRHRG